MSEYKFIYGVDMRLTFSYQPSSSPLMRADKISKLQRTPMPMNILRYCRNLFQIDKSNRLHSDETRHHRVFYDDVNFENFPALAELGLMNYAAVQGGPSARGLGYVDPVPTHTHT